MNHKKNELEKVSTERVHLTISKIQYKAIKNCAEKKSMSVNALIRLIIEEWMVGK